MTQPDPSTDPATDPATDPTTDPAPEPDPTTDPQGDPDDDARVKRANAQAQRYRQELRDTQAKLDEQGQTLAALAAVFNPGSTTTDPAEQLAAITGEADNLRTANAQLRAELAVHTLAADNGANPVALLDSRSFANTLHGLDPAADDYQQQVAEAIKAAVQQNATLAAQGQAPQRGGAPGAGQGPVDTGGVTQEQFNAMGLTQRQQLFQSDPDTYRRLAAAIR